MPVNTYDGVIHYTRKRSIHIPKIVSQVFSESYRYAMSTCIKKYIFMCVHSYISIDCLKSRTITQGSICSVAVAVSCSFILWSVLSNLEIVSLHTGAPQTTIVML